HPRGPVPVPGARLATPNRAEAAGFLPEVPGDGLAAVTARARRLAERWTGAGVAVTLGPGGGPLAEGAGAPLSSPPPPATTGDPCGPGDRFSATAAGLLGDGALPSEAVVGAVPAAPAFVAAGGASPPPPRPLHPPGVGRRWSGPWSWSRSCGPWGGRWWPPVAASICCTPGMWRRCGRPGRSGTVW